MSTRWIFIAIGIVGIALTFALAFILGITAANPTQRGLEEKLLLVRKKAAECQQERERARSQQKRAPNWDQTPVGKIQKENDRLADENNKLMDENESLREDKTQLDEQLMELQHEYDEKTEISNQEKEEITGLQQSGNISDILKDFLEDQQQWGPIEKDDLIPKLIDELKWRKTRFQACQRAVGTAYNRIDQTKQALAQKEKEDKLKAAQDKLEKQQQQIQDLLDKAKGISGGGAQQRAAAGTTTGATQITQSQQMQQNAARPLTEDPALSSILASLKKQDDAKAAAAAQVQAAQAQQTAGANQLNPTQLEQIKALVAGQQAQKAAAQQIQQPVQTQAVAQGQQQQQQQLPQQQQAATQAQATKVENLSADQLAKLMDMLKTSGK